VGVERREGRCGCLIMIKYMYLSPFTTSDPLISKVSRDGRDLKGDTLIQLYGFYMV